MLPCARAHLRDAEVHERAPSAAVAQALRDLRELHRRQVRLQVPREGALALPPNVWTWMVEAQNAELQAAQIRAEERAVRREELLLERISAAEAAAKPAEP